MSFLIHAIPNHAFTHLHLQSMSRRTTLHFCINCLSSFVRTSHTMPQHTTSRHANQRHATLVHKLPVLIRAYEPLHVTTRHVEPSYAMPRFCIKCLFSFMHICTTPRHTTPRHATLLFKLPVLICACGPRHVTPHHVTACQATPRHATLLHKLPVLIRAYEPSRQPR